MAEKDYTLADTPITFPTAAAAVGRIDKSAVLGQIDLPFPRRRRQFKTQLAPVGIKGPELAADGNAAIRFKLQVFRHRRCAVYGKGRGHQRRRQRNTAKQRGDFPYFSHVRTNLR